MENAEWIIWLALLIGSIVLESLSMQLFSIWFAAGALVALIATLLGAEVWLEVTLFVVVTAASLAATRPLVKKLMRGKVQPTNADSNIGKTGIVIEAIDNRRGLGQIKVGGVTWTARSLTDDAVIPVEQLVEVKEIQGVKAMVILAGAADATVTTTTK
ncbi:MAG: NfeD family protein [Oscillospiraceae bacterium]|jgi:membrane protein implicated in regulation of membrane protease activity|nr:NfeD family protein [Oscillospiraceae bacterium]